MKIDTNLLRVNTFFTQLCHEEALLYFSSSSFFFSSRWSDDDDFDQCQGNFMKPKSKEGGGGDIVIDDW